MLHANETLYHQSTAGFFVFPCMVFGSFSLLVLITHLIDLTIRPSMILSL
ncbi:hypothetical protein LguiA_025600 [Lonicera macranthoides]